MIKFTLAREPAKFDIKCRQRGLKWLRSHPKPTPKKGWRPKDYWSPFRGDLSVAFHATCSLGAMHEPAGTVDHFISCDTDETKAFEWDNYRFVSQWLNSSKNNRNGFLDPFDVEDDWFRVSLPDLQLHLTNAIPASHQAAAEFTISSLPIRDDERIIRQRRHWYEMYQTGELTINGLRRVAPLIAKAIEANGGVAP
ncbi:hypothetical protein OAS39_03000 [Pirellulales bacterium]|nr:hypothetical protein [Pirellulales bacterium]